MKLTHALAMVASAMLDMDMDAQADGRLRGYALTQRSGVRSVLYPQLDRMLHKGWVDDRWETVEEVSEKRPLRRYCILTDEGRAELRLVVRRAARDPRFTSQGTNTRIAPELMRDFTR